MAINSVWVSNIKTPEAQEDFRQLLYRSKTTLERLDEILYGLESDLDRIEFNPKFYETPNWDYKQASNNGYRRCISQIRNLINLDQKDNNERPVST